MSSVSETFTPKSNSSGSASTSARLTTSTAIKSSKAQAASQTLLRPEVVYVSSDSSPSTPGPLKRDSSGLSILDEPPPHPLKRQKVIGLEEKENILRTSSKANHVVTKIHIPTHGITHSDLDSKPLETLKQYQIYGLGLRNYFADECLEFHSGKNTEKDIVLLEEIRELIRNRLQAVEATKKSLEGRPNIDTLPKINNPVTSFQNLGTTIPPIQVVLEPTRNEPFQHQLQTSSISELTNDDLASDDGYWEGMEDVSMHDFNIPSTSDSSPSGPKAISPSGLTSSPYYGDIMHNLHKVFKLTTFRTNQLEAITAALDGKDVFVLMPTGGGKSLCFQLPAICTSGKTKGVSVVVSPLLALMKDQVDSLINKQVDALLSNADTAGDDWQRLVKSERKPKLWYVTPEKLRDSPKVNEILAILHRDDNLARFIVDEAHCISTWGQDFRDAYTALGTLRDKYPSVPIMALTATANKRTVADIITQLKLKDHAFFTQSFNRTNLKYTVQRKKSNGINDIVTFIESKHRGEGGVIYCNARTTCETVAQNLRDKGLSAAHFHAGMPTQEKDQTVHDWQSGSTSIIVATIAFGMGIDKADVRFVIHRDMPKSMSGYYQETGRAGRDGKPADCLMYFSANDLSKLIHQIKKTEGATPESIQRQENAVREVYQFCENTSECRRVQILQHFDEKFTKALCGRGCDTCEDGRETVSENVTPFAQGTIKLVQFLVTERGDKVTVPQIRAILAGANTADNRSKQYDTLPQYGLCNKLPKELIELMLNRLMLFEMLDHVSVANRSGFHNDYLKLGPKAQNFLDSRQELILDWHPKPRREPKQRKKAATGESISAPPRSRKGKQKALLEDDPIEVPDDMYDWDDPEDISYNIPYKHPTAGPSRDIASTGTVTSNPIPAKELSPATSSRAQPADDSVQVLYNKMLVLRNEIMAKENVRAGDVFDDTDLQYLSAVCPSDYHSFKTELSNTIDMDGPEGSEYVTDKWNKYGQQFLELCIQHKTGSSSKAKPVAQTICAASLHSKYEYRPPVSSSSMVSTPAMGQKSRSKFKPAVPS